MFAFLVALAAAPAPHLYMQVYSFAEADSCTRWTQYRAEKTSNPLQGWVLGFVSGRNAFGSGNGNIAPGLTAEGLTVWIDRYCMANPRESVTTAGFKLVDELERQDSGKHR